MPTSEWNAATSSGIDVIGTRRAITAPMPPGGRKAENHQQAGADAARRMGRQRRDDRDRHADHAEQVAGPAGFRARQAAQCHDEKHAGDEVEKSDDIGIHAGTPLISFFFVSRRPRRARKEARSRRR
jgi:hypothetical protein